MTSDGTVQKFAVTASSGNVAMSGGLTLSAAVATIAHSGTSLTISSTSLRATSTADIQITAASGLAISATSTTFTSGPVHVSSRDLKVTSDGTVSVFSVTASSGAVAMT